MNAKKNLVVGAELDGSTLRVIRVEDRTITYYERFPNLSSTSAAAMMRQVLKGNGSAVLAWASPGIAVRRIPVPLITDRKATQVIREIINRQIPAGSELPGAGLVQSYLDSPQPVAMVGAITSDAARVLKHELGNAPCSVRVSPFTLQHDGLYLAIRESCTELTLMRGGIPVTTRQLNCGGLSSWSEGDASVLSLTALSGEHIAALRRYLASLAREVHRTIELWDRNGDACPRSLWAFGVGATLPHLPTFLKNVGITIKPAPVGSSIDVSIIPVAERLAAYGALVAATTQFNLQPFADVSRVLGHRLGKSTKSSPSSRKNEAFEGVLTSDGSRGFARPNYSNQSESTVPRGTAGALVGAVLAFLFMIFSWVSSGRAVESADRSLENGKRQLANSQIVASNAKKMATAAADLNKFVQAVPPNWTKDIVLLFSSLPAKPVIEDVSFSIDNGMVQAQFTVAIPSDLAEEWKAALDSSGAIISTKRMDSSANGPTEYMCNFPIHVADQIKGDA
jgi:hypothetical protein